MENQIEKSISDRDILELSLRLEREGQVFYKKLSEMVSDPSVKRFVDEMHKEETQHEKIFRIMLENKNEDTYGWEDKKDLKEFIDSQLQADIFPNLDTNANTSQFKDLNTAVDFALEAEMIAAEFYALLGEYCDNLEAKTSLALLEKAENEHLKQVLSIKQNLLDTE